MTGFAVKWLGRGGKGEMLGVAVKSVFAALGLEIRKKRSDASASAPRASTGALRQLVGLGLRPKTVIDVGVAYGTTELYETMAEAQFLLIEPLAEFEPFLRRICEKYNAQYVLAAA